MRPLVLGEAPSKSGDRYWQFPLSGAVGERLCTWAGIEPLRHGTRYGQFYWPLRERFDLANVIERWPGSKGRGAAFPEDAGHAGIERLFDEGELPPGRVVICLGRRVQRLLMPELPFHVWMGPGSVTDLGEELRLPLYCAAVPHPSGLTRNYNDQSEQELTGQTLRRALEWTS